MQGDHLIFILQRQPCKRGRKKKDNCQINNNKTLLAMPKTIYGPFQRITSSKHHIPPYRERCKIQEATFWSSSCLKNTSNLQQLWDQNRWTSQKCRNPQNLTGSHILLTWQLLSRIQTRIQTAWKCMLVGPTFVHNKCPGLLCQGWNQHQGPNSSVTLNITW